MEHTELAAGLQDHEAAFTEISFLLRVLTGTIGDVVGNSMPSLAVSAGRQMAGKMPVYLSEPDLETVLQTLARSLEAGFELTCKPLDKGAEITVGRCAIREVCDNQGLEPGDRLCQMLHHYWAGMIAELLGRPARIRQCTPGCQCTLVYDIR